MKVIISFVASMMFGGATAVLILSMRTFVPNGYTTRVEFAIAVGFLFFLAVLSMALHIIQMGELLKQIRNNLYDHKGNPLFVPTVELQEKVEEIIRLKKLHDKLEAESSKANADRAGMRRLANMQRELEASGYTMFGKPDKQNEFVELNDKYGEMLAAENAAKLKTENAALNAPTTINKPVVWTFDPNRGDDASEGSQPGHLPSA